MQNTVFPALDPERCLPQELCPGLIFCNASVPYCYFFAVALQKGEMQGKIIILKLFVPLETDAHSIKMHFCIIVTQSSS